MMRLNLFYVLAFILLITVAGAAVRSRRSPQFGQARAGASASAGAFGGFGGQPRPGFGHPNLGSGFGNNAGYPRPGFGGPSGFGGHSGFGAPSRFGGSGGSINIAKSISISRGSGGPSQASASSFGKK